MQKKLLPALIAASCISPSTFSSNLVDGRYQWEFLSGFDWPIGYNQNNGKPNNLTWSYPEYSEEFFDRIANALPEAKVNEAFLTDDAGANITLSENAEVFVTFLHEGAGYKNSFGYFTFDKEQPPTTVSDIDEVIVFPNLSFPHLTNGHRLSLGSFPAGTSIGFFIAANGFSYYTGVKDTYAPHYYSLKALNPDPDGLKQHNVLLFDGEFNEVIIGFEDLPRSWGDNDFNDAVFSIKTTPETAIDSTTIVAIPASDDSDADGVPDTEDDYPDDFHRAYRTFFPSANDWVTLAFEDNWPSTGDYDMNDLVLRERFEKIYNANEEITGFKISGFIDARGAQNNSGFALRLMDKAPDTVKTAKLTIDNTTFEKNLEENQSDAVISLWSDSHIFTATGESGPCSHFNTHKECSNFDPVAFELDVYFEGTVESLTHSSLDFFIYSTDFRGREIHFADYPPTDLFDSSQFGKYEDTSIPSEGRYFRNQDNLPWAIKVMTKWRYPQEYIDVLWAYPDYEQWVESSGNEATDWFSTSDRDTHYY